jgi:hypothetical protein
VQTKKLELFIRDQSNVQDNLRTAIDAPYICDVVEHLRVETTRGDSY